MEEIIKAKVLLQGKIAIEQYFKGSKLEDEVLEEENKAINTILNYVQELESKAIDDKTLTYYQNIEREFTNKYRGIM